MGIPHESLALGLVMQRSPSLLFFRNPITSFLRVSGRMYAGFSSIYLMSLSWYFDIRKK